MAKIRILYTRYLNDDGKPLIGGVESYITALSEVANDMGFEVCIYQYSSSNFERKVNNATVIGFAHAHSCDAIFKHMYRTEGVDLSKDIVIFATDFLICKCRFTHTLAIQHGVAWDITTTKPTSRVANMLNILKGSIRSIHKVNRFSKCKTLVCVDYNFINWFRTQVKSIDFDYHVIPNFARATSRSKRKQRDEDDVVRILFARRLVPYRGTRLFCSAICSLLNENYKIQVTIAGDGPDLPFLKERLSKYENVAFTTFASGESVEVHSQFDIAVVPTIGSEGTSLSLLEAMSAGCAVIATNIGGMTNVVIDDYNGLLIKPQESQLTSALKKLVTDGELRKRLSNRAVETIGWGFSYEKWKLEWTQLLNNQ